MLIKYFFFQYTELNIIHERKNNDNKHLEIIRIVLRNIYDIKIRTEISDLKKISIFTHK